MAWSAGGESTTCALEETPVAKVSIPAAIATNQKLKRSIMAAPYRLSGRVFVFHSYKPSAKLVDACANRIYSPIGCLLDGKNGLCLHSLYRGKPEQKCIKSF